MWNKGAHDEAAPHRPRRRRDGLLFRKGHRIRLALAGADKDTFTRIPESGFPTWTIERNRALRSELDLPVIERR